MAFNSFTKTEDFEDLKITRMFWSEGSLGGNNGSTIPTFFRIYGNMNIEEPKNLFILLNDARPFETSSDEKATDSL